MVKRSLRGKKTKMRGKRTKMKYLKRTGRKKSKKRRRGNLKKKKGGALAPPAALIGVAGLGAKAVHDRLTAEGERTYNIDEGWGGKIRVNSGSEIILKFNITNSESLGSFLIDVRVEGRENQDINVIINGADKIVLGRVHDGGGEFYAEKHFAITLDNKHSYVTSKDVNIEIRKKTSEHEKNQRAMKDTGKININVHYYNSDRAVQSSSISIEPGPTTPATILREVLGYANQPGHFVLYDERSLPIESTRDLRNDQNVQNQFICNCI